MTVDCLRGRYEIDYVKCCHDFGSSMNTAVDNGQIEGGIVQGLGWVTMEEVVYDADGKLRSNALDIQSPRELSFRTKRDHNTAARNKPRTFLRYKTRS